MRKLSIRLRLTLFVTAAFVIALVCAGTIARQRLETTLIDTARNNAEQTLAESFFTNPSELDSVGVIVGEGITRFVFTDLDGTELDQAEFAKVVNQATASQLAELGFFLEFGAFAVEDLILADPNELPFLGVTESITVVQPIEPIGEPTSSDTDDQIIVSQLTRVGDEELSISVSTPRQPLNDSLAAFTYFGLAMIPLLGAGVAAATWLTTSRVLQPVEDIRRQVEQTDADRLNRHVPRSGNGDEIDRLAGTMNDMLDRLRIASDRQRQFVSDASHELRSPITATLATLETTSADEAGNRWPEIAATLTAEQTRLARLVDDLLLMATVDESPARSVFVDVDLDELILAEAARPHVANVHAHVVEPHRVAANAGLLQRCVGNLVENAARHTTSTVDVTVTTAEGGHPMIRVDDDGPGIPEDRLENIFERFARIDDARNRREGGAGLGLAIANNIARQHGATLRASNRTEGGARFELVFDQASGIRS